MDLDAAAIINPTESLSNGVKAKKIAMTIIQPFRKKVQSYSVEEYNGGMKFALKSIFSQAYLLFHYGEILTSRATLFHWRSAIPT